ncbi:MAG: diacylglycerol kinase family protein [Anaerolineaceae bacterium]|jgi:diacylglycerol kinase|nr:diacylglycerol kinase family protein [Anaerolineaceae bacterium]
MINIRAIFKSIKYAFEGFLHVVKTQNNARFHLLATIIVVSICVWLKINPVEWCLILVAIALVWIAECFNTTLESFFDLVNPEPHPLVKNGKDSGAAAVLVAAFLSIALGIIVLGPPLIQKLQFLLRE